MISLVITVLRPVRLGLLTSLQSVGLTAFVLPLRLVCRQQSCLVHFAAISRTACLVSPLRCRTGCLVPLLITLGLIANFANAQRTAKDRQVDAGSEATRLQLGSRNTPSRNTAFIPSWPADLGGFSSPRWSCLSAPIGNHRARLAVMSALEVERTLCGNRLPDYPRKPVIYNRIGPNRTFVVEGVRHYEIWIWSESPEDFYFLLEGEVIKLVERHQ